METSKRFYTYAYLREDGTPYYIGKGKNSRVYDKRHTVKVPPKERILFLKKNLSDHEAIKHEMYMIAIFGRKNIGTGILRNLTNGGEGMSGYKHSEEFIMNMRINNPSKIPKNRKLIGDRSRGKNNHMYGKRGKDSPFYGKKRDKLVVEKIAESLRKITYAIISPSGEKFITKNMTEFCQKYNLDRSTMVAVSLKKKKHHKGWVCCKMEGDKFPENFKKYETKKYYLISPDGKKYVIENLYQFCIEKQLHNSAMYRVINRKNKHHKGWTTYDPSINHL